MTTLNTTNPAEAPLPVELTSFLATPQANAILLNWQSASEVNFSGYELQRSTDALEFERIAWVPGIGGNELRDYRHVDSAVRTNTTYYYRLKILDQNGDFAYSPVRSALVPGPAGTVKVYPNPASNELFVSFFAENPEALRVDIFNETGSLVLSREFQISAGENLLQLPLHELSSGWFVLRAAAGKWVASEKFYRR